MGLQRLDGRDLAEYRDRGREQLVGRSSAGFTLIELVIVIAVLGILAAVAIPRLGSMSASARQAATRAEMQRLKSAILGTPDAQGHARSGFELDVGHPPNRLSDLAARPDTVPAWNAFLSLGWNGPYIDSAGGDYLRDAWDSTYAYDAVARTVTSTGGGSNLVLSF